MTKANGFHLAYAAIFLLGCNDSVNAGIPDLSSEPVFAVQRGNFAGSSAIALLDGDGKLMEASYISSGTEVATLSAALAGDIFLPSSPCDPALLTVGARLGGNYILQVNLSEADVERQIKTQNEPKEAVFGSNPQDVLCLRGGRALVSRLGLNLNASRADLDRGDDLAVLDFARGQVVSRIDLRAFEGKVRVEGTDSEETTYASPGNIVRVGQDHALVGLSRLTEHLSSSNAEGAVALVDLNELKVALVKLEGFANCGALFAVPGRANMALVQCAGAPYGSLENAGLVQLEVTDGKARVAREFRAERNGQPLIGNPTPLDAERVVVVTADFVEGTPDQAYLVDLESGAQELLFEASAPGDIGLGAVRLETGLVLIPDATAGVRAFKLDDDGVKPLHVIALDGAIPARSVRPLRDF